MRARFSHFSNEIARASALTFDLGGADTGYGLDRLTNDNPAYVMRSPDTALAIQIDCGVATPIAALALIHCTAEADDDVRIQGNSSASWVSPPFDLPFPIAGWIGAGASRWPLNAWMDLTAQEGYPEGGYRYYRLAFGLTTPLAQPLQLGELRIHATLDDFYVDRNLGEDPQKPDVVNSTASGVDHVVSRGTTRWGLKLSLGGFEDAERTAFKAHWYDVNAREHPWLYLDDEECRLVRWDSDMYQLARATTKQAALQGTIREVSRGLRPGTDEIET